MKTPHYLKTMLPKKKFSIDNFEKEKICHLSGDSIFFYFRFVKKILSVQNSKFLGLKKMIKGQKILDLWYLSEMFLSIWIELKLI